MCFLPFKKWDVFKPRKIPIWLFRYAFWKALCHSRKSANCLSLSLFKKRHLTVFGSLLKSECSITSACLAKLHLLAGICNLQHEWFILKSRIKLWVVPFHAECAFLSSILWHFLSLPQKNIPELPRPMFSKQICSRSFVIDLEYTWPKNNPLPGEINWYYSGVITKVQSGVQCTALYGVQLRCWDRAKRATFGLKLSVKKRLSNYFFERVCSRDRRQAS